MKKISGAVAAITTIIIATGNMASAQGWSYNTFPENNVQGWVHKSPYMGEMTVKAKNGIMELSNIYTGRSEPTKTFSGSVGVRHWLPEPKQDDKYMVLEFDLTAYTETQTKNEETSETTVKYSTSAPGSSILRLARVENDNQFNTYDFGANTLFSMQMNAGAAWTGSVSWLQLVDYSTGSAKIVDSAFKHQTASSFYNADYTEEKPVTSYKMIIDLEKYSYKLYVKSTSVAGGWSEISCKDGYTNQNHSEKGYWLSSDRIPNVIALGAKTQYTSNSGFISSKTWAEVDNFKAYTLKKEESISKSVLFDNNGDEVTSIEKDKKYRIATAVNNNTDSNIAFSLIGAQFDNNYNYLGMTYNNVSAAIGSNMYVSEDFTVSSEANTVESYVWNSLDDMVPLADYSDFTGAQ